TMRSMPPPAGPAAWVSGPSCASIRARSPRSTPASRRLPRPSPGRSASSMRPSRPAGRRSRSTARWSTCRASSAPAGCLPRRTAEPIDFPEEPRMSTPTIDIEHLRGWVGRSQSDSDPALARHARLMAATIDRPGPPLADGDPLPHCWHWLYFLEGLPPGRLGPDGHPERGGFMPPVPLPNRMWAGGELRFEGEVPLGATMDKRSTIKSVEHKTGRSGDLVFVTVEHEISVEGSRRIHELQNIVYKSPAPAGNAKAPADGGSALGQHVRRVKPDSTMLFR